MFEVKKFPQVRRKKSENFYGNNFLAFVIENVGPLSALNKKIEEKSLMPDEHQLKVVGELQKLYEVSNNYNIPATAIGGWFSFARKKPKIENEIKGLYIYGSVGGGKTMLMDLFFDCCKVIGLEIFLDESEIESFYF